MSWYKLPTTATALFCPSEVQGSVLIPKDASFLKKVFIFLGPGLLVSVGYMDPGNWATTIEAGSRYGYNLLFVVMLSSLFAIFLQCLSLRIKIAPLNYLLAGARLPINLWKNSCSFFL